MGGPSILLATPHVNAIILWDPSPPKLLKLLSPVCKYNKKLNAFVIDHGVQTIMNKQMYNEMKESHKWIDAIKATKIPIKIIGASNNMRVSGCKEYYKNANRPKKLVFIKGAGHSFNEELSNNVHGAFVYTEENLFKETLEWINKY